MAKIQWYDGLYLPQTGDYELQVIAPGVIELTRYTTTTGIGAAPSIWNFVNPTTFLLTNPPDPSGFIITSQDTLITNPVTMTFAIRTGSFPAKQPTIVLSVH